MHGAAFFYDNSRLTLPQEFAAGLAAALRAQEDMQESGAINPKTSRKRPEKYVLYLENFGRGRGRRGTKTYPRPVVS